MKNYALLVLLSCGFLSAAFADSAEDFARNLELAKTGDRHAQLAVALVYMHGAPGVPYNPAAAAVWFQRAAEQGDLEAQRQMGALQMYNPPEARRWYRLAAEQGDALSAYNLGDSYAAVGLKIKAEPEEAFKWYLRSAELGAARGMGKVAELYAAGRGVAANPAAAQSWRRKAAEAGYSPAQFALAESLFTAKASPAEIEQAFGWYFKAAEQGHAGAIGKISNALFTGQGLKQDYVEFLAWITVKSVPQDYAEFEAQMKRMLSGQTHEPDSNASHRRKAEKIVGPDGVRAALKRVDEIEAKIAASRGIKVAEKAPEATAPANASRPEPGSTAGEQKDALPFGAKFAKLFSAKEVQTAPVATTRSAPAYPFDLRRAGITGHVIVEFIIDTEGNVADVRVVEASHPGFVEPALRAVRQWKFKPGRINTRPVNVLATQQLDFSQG